MTNTTEQNPYLDGPEDWTAALDLIVQHVPPIATVKLIVEGCIGSDDYCSYFVTKAIPECTYVGADIEPTLSMLTRDRVDGGISTETFEQIAAAQPSIRSDRSNVSKFTLRANCLSPDFVHSLKEHSEAETAMLVTYNGLVALMGRDFNPGKRKRDEDLTPSDSVVGSDLYDFQLHITESERFPDLWESTPNVISRWYYGAEEIAEGLQRPTIRLKNGLLIFRDAN